MQIKSYRAPLSVPTSSHAQPLKKSNPSLVRISEHFHSSPGPRTQIVPAPVLSPSFPVSDGKGYRTLLVSAGKDGNLGDVHESLETLEKEGGDRFRELQSGGPVTLLESSKLYRVHESYLGKLNELKKVHPEVSAVNLADILNARPRKSGFKKDELGSKRPDVQIRALLALEKGLAGGTVELSEDDKATAAKGTFNLNSGLSRIYNSIRGDWTLSRREELLEENPDWAYDQLQARAEEMLAAEPLPELERVGKLMASSAAVLDGLNSKQSQSLQLKFLNQADGAILSDVANDPKRAERVVDAMTSLFQRRLDQTQKLLPDPTMKRRASRASGPHNFLPGGYERVSVRERSKDDPFDNVPLGPLQLFGTRQGGMLGGALSKLILAYDERLAGLQETYRVSEFEREETRVRKNLQAFSETVDPESIERSVQAQLESFKKNEFRELTGQLDLSKLVARLSWPERGFPGVGSEGEAAKQKAELFVNLLQGVTNPALYREVADAAIGFLARRSGDNLSGPSRNALVNCLTTPGPDPEVHSAAARILSSLSEAQLVKTKGDL